jgi:hypothetical protein
MEELKYISVQAATHSTSYHHTEHTETANACFWGGAGHFSHLLLKMLSSNK